MPLTTFGKQWLRRKIAGGVGGKYPDEAAYYIEQISVGNGVTAVTGSDERLAGTGIGTGLQHKTLTASDITENNDRIVITAIFSNTEANFVWNEAGIWVYNGTNRKLIYRELIPNGTRKLSTMPRQKVIALPITEIN